MAPTTKASFGRDIQGYNTLFLPPSNTMFALQPSSNTHTAVTVPSDAATYLAVFRYTENNDIFVSVGNTAVVPASHTFISTNCELNPPGYIVKAGQTIDFVTIPSNLHIIVSFYALS